MPEFQPLAVPADGLTKEQRDLLAAPIRVPPGFGMRVLSREEKAAALLEDAYAGLYDKLLIWEPPRKGFLYVVSVDVSNGRGLDNSVIDVTRVGTIREPDEQVAQFVTCEVEHDELAYFIDPIGRLYQGRDGMPALLAIECNAMGIGTQAELQKHLGYPNFFIWQTLDHVDPGKAYTHRIGWYTTPRSRPIILGRYYKAVKTVDPHTGLPDYRINSPLTQQELQTFVSPTRAIWMAEAAPGAHDDCIMAGAIGVYVAQTLQETFRETVHEARRRLSEESARISEKEKLSGLGISPQTTDISANQLNGIEDDYDLDPHQHMI